MRPRLISITFNTYNKMNTIHIAKAEGRHIRTRQTMRGLFERLPAVACILDFTGVEFISRSVADEVVAYATHTHSTITNATGTVGDTLEAVRRTRRGGRKNRASESDIASPKSIRELKELLGGW